MTALNAFYDRQDNMRGIKTVIADACKEDLFVLQFIQQLHEIFETQGNLLYDERNVLKSYRLKTPKHTIREVIVKRYKRPNLFQRIVYSFFRKSKAKRAFYNAQVLRNRGIETPHEIAFIEQKKDGLLEYCYFISESNYDPPIEKELVLPAVFNQKLAKSFADYAGQLHARGILHHDLNPTNILYHETGDGAYAFAVIDINRMKILADRQYPPVKSCLWNLTKFTCRMDLFEYVIRCYCKARGLDESFVQKAIRLKEIHDRKRKRRKAFLKYLKSKERRSASSGR
jgi:tRNA A-37 threonylcarbamoyl transferase component Bud32